MTALQEQAVALIRQMSDDQVYYLVHMLKSLGTDSSASPAPLSQSMQAYQALQKYRKASKEELNYKVELAAAREKKYANIS